MAEYWGAQAYWPSGGPDGRARYTQTEPDAGFQFTMPEGDRNSATIEVVHRQIMNQHPEDISALADQWQNAYNLLSSIRQQLFDQSDTLYHEHWKSPTAREAFMRAGPGKTLAYLDMWMTAASNNVTSLRAMVGIVTRSRTDMTKLWNEYTKAVNDAKTLGTGEEIKTFFQVWKSWGDAERDEAVNDLRHAQDEYNKKAQQLAYRVASEYFETFSGTTTGYGPPFTPMDAVLNVVGHKPWRPPGTPPTGQPPPVTTRPPLIKTAPTDPNRLQQKVLQSLRQPPRVTTVTTPSLPPDGLVAPLPVSTARPVRQVAPPPGAGSVVRPVGPGAGENVARPSGLPPGTGSLRSSGVLRAAATTPSQPGVGSESQQAALRSPAAPPPAPGRGAPGRKPPGAGAQEQRLPGSPSAETEDAFGRPPGSTAPPVLKSSRPVPQRSGRSDRLAPPATSGPGTPAHPDATPPVLKSPAKNPTRTAAVPPGQTRHLQQGPGRPRETGADWLGLEEIRTNSSTPVVDAPAPPVTGAAVSRLEEVPTGLRNASADAARAAQAGARTDAVAPELTNRRTTSEDGPVVPVGIDEGNDGQRIVADEDAFSVDTPGGGVLAKQREEQNYRAEPPTVLGGK